MTSQSKPWWREWSGVPPLGFVVLFTGAFAVFLMVLAIATGTSSFPAAVLCGITGLGIGAWLIKRRPGP
jgi:hypothetical protein